MDNEDKRTHVEREADGLKVFLVFLLILGIVVTISFEIIFSNL